LGDSMDHRSGSVNVNVQNVSTLKDGLIDWIFNDSDATALPSASKTF
jgi:hypothetical protein